MPRLLDLFCGAGGASVGYARAGFEVVGVDLYPQKHYPFAFVQADALSISLAGFDVIHASPPCQRYSALTNPTASQHLHPDYIDVIRQRLLKSGRPYVIENVARSPLKGYIQLCGTQFNLKVLRHRWFESSVKLTNLGTCVHEGSTMDGTYVGHVEGGTDRHGKPRPNWTKQQRQAAIGIDWMTGMEMRQAIPPAYTEYIGRQLLNAA